MIRSGGLAVVRLQQPAEPLAAEDLAFGGHRRIGLDDPSAQNPMWPLGEIMGVVLLDHISDLLLAKQDHLIETLGFYGKHIALRIWIRLQRQLHLIRTMGMECSSSSIPSILATASGSR